MGNEVAPGWRDVIGVKDVTGRQVESTVTEALLVGADPGDGGELVYEAGKDVIGQGVFDDEVRVGIRLDRTSVSSSE